MTTVNWGNNPVNVADIPAHVVTIYLQRALNHVFNNEAVAAVKDAPDAEKPTELAAWRASKLAAIMSGAITMRAGGTRGDAVAAEMRRLARIRVGVALREKNVKQKDADVPALVAEYITKHGDALRATAEKNVADTGELPAA